MNRNMKAFLIIVGSLIGVVVLIGVGFAMPRLPWRTGNFYPGSMMDNFDPNVRNSYGMGSGMMDDGNFGKIENDNNLNNLPPLSIEETRGAVESYLAALGNEDLAIEEIMVFDNNAYAIVIEESTGIGAFELLVDPDTRAVFPEYGPNIMWNLKYGTMMGNAGVGSGNMMSNFDLTDNAAIAEIPAVLPVSEDDAAKAAQEYLNKSYSGAEITDEITAFYGYYTVDFEQDGEIIGMLSVNGFTRQVFLHAWHGEFIEMSEV